MESRIISLFKRIENLYLGESKQKSVSDLQCDQIGKYLSFWATFESHLCPS